MTLSTLTYRRSSLPGKAYLAALALAGMVFYMFNVLTTLKGDDMLYSYIIGTDYVPIRSLAGWLKSLPGLYVQENGRMANILTQLFAGVLGKPVFDVLNALMLVLLLHLVVVHVAGKARPVAVVAITMLMIFAVIPYPGETLLWMCGSLNYLWATTFTLYWLHWLHSRRNSRLMAWQQVALFLASWVAGQMNEAVTVPVALGLCMWLVATRKRPDVVLLTAMAGYSLGVLFIVCSPGAWARVRSGDVNLAGSAAWLLGRRLLVVGYKAVIYVFPATAVLLMTWEWKHHGWRKLAADLWPWIMLGCVLLLYALGDSKKPRLYFFFTLVGYIYTMRWLYCRYGSRARLRCAAAVLCALACIYPVAAVGVMKKMVADAGLAAGYEIDSAGIGDWHVGQLPDSRMRNCGARRGYNFNSRARQFDKTVDFDRFDNILVMDRNNYRAITSMAPDDEARDKVHMLTDYCVEHAGAEAVPDPYYGGDSGFELVLDLLEDAVEGLLDQLENK